MSEFDLQKAIDGAPLVTRDGHKARLICHDRKDIKTEAHLIALILGGSGNYERIVQYLNNGEQANWCRNLDLMLKD